MVQYRGHTSRWQLIKSVSLLLFVGALAAFNGFQIYRGVTTGGIESLKRRSQELVMFDTEPKWFIFNLLIRLIVILFFLVMLGVFWKQRAKPEFQDF